MIISSFILNLLKRTLVFATRFNHSVDSKWVYLREEIIYLWADTI